MAGIDGLMLTGGDDVDAVALRRDGACRRSVEAEPGRDEFEIALVAAARARELPIFAICRGVQVLNVACGGTLVQDIPSQIPGALRTACRSRRTSRTTLAHEIWVDKDSLLATLMRERLSRRRVEVNSRHHQAVKDVAQRASVVTATAPDGVIEAIEDPRRALLPRRPVAPGELLPHRRVPRAVRGIPRGGLAEDLSDQSYVSR